MTRSEGAAELHMLLREALGARLAPTGWMPDDGQATGPDSSCVGAFRLHIADCFAATASFSRAQSMSDRPPLWVTGARVGVSYEPLQRLWPLLVDRVPACELETGVEELLVPPREVEIQVLRSADVAAAADELSGPVLEHAVSYAQRYASVDALIAAHTEDDDEDEDGEEVWGVSRVVPALLAAARRFDEARDALARYVTHGRDDERFVRQLTRWLDADGRLALPPPSLPPELPRRKTLGEIRADRRVRREAVGAARAVASGQSPAAFRAALEAELERRELTESPLWIEHQLDQMQASPGDRAVQAAKALKALGGWSIGLAKMLRDGTPPERSDWLEPPMRAAFPMPTRRGTWIEVDVDAAATDWLDRVHAAAPTRIGDSATIDAWLAWDSAGPATDHRLAVHIGERRVGHLAAPAATAYQQVMDAAQLRDELPWLRARLTRRPSPNRYLLEIRAPAG
jgi:hypothetical protein